jgi:hypothetical protein
VKTISARAIELARECDQNAGLPDGYTAVGVVELWKALDEWQASVEERLARAMMIPDQLPIARVGDAVGHDWDHASQTAARYEPEPVESEE